MPAPLARSDAAPPEPAEPAAATSPSALTIACEERGGVVLVTLAGDFDTATTAGFWEHVRRYDPAQVQMLINLAGVGLLDAAGLGALVSLRNLAHVGGRRLALVCPDRRLGRLFWFTGLRPQFVFGNNVLEVLDALAARSGGAEARQGRAG